MPWRVELLTAYFSIQMGSSVTPRASWHHRYLVVERCDEHKILMSSTSRTVLGRRYLQLPTPLNAPIHEISNGVESWVAFSSQS